MKKSIQNRKIHFHKNVKGATLVELLLTIALLALISSVFMQLLTKSIDLRLQGATYTEANKLANAYAEQIKKYSVMPSGGSETLSNFMGTNYQIKATWTDQSSSVVNASSTSVTQSLLSSQASADMTLTLTDSAINVVPMIGSSESKPSDSIDLNKVNFSCTYNQSTSNDYEVHWTNNGQSQQVNLGSKNGDAVIRLYAQTNLTKHIDFAIANNAGNTLTIQIVDDVNSRISILDESTLGKIKTVTGLVSNNSSGELVEKHYSVQIQVYRGSEKISELLSAVTIQ